MKTKEAIRFMKAINKLYSDDKFQNFIGKIDEVIECLRHGKKYEKMFLQIVNREKEDRIIVKSDLDEFKQKHFPKEK